MFHHRQTPSPSEADGNMTDPDLILRMSVLSGTSAGKMGEKYNSCAEVHSNVYWSKVTAKTGVLNSFICHRQLPRG